MSAYGKPYLVAGFNSDTESFKRLEPLGLRSSQSGYSYNEVWLQALIDKHPDVLPIEEIEPGIVEPVSVCRELGLPHGYVDNLLITPDGDIVVVETKLWRNFESRRKVIAQILDYAADLTGLSYEELEKKIGQARKARPFQLFHFVNPDALPEFESRFISRVSRNLRLGRMLLLVVGDGIQEQADELSSFLQRHIQLHFTLGLVEIALAKVPEQDSILVLPRVLAKSLQIERAVIRVSSQPHLDGPEIMPAAATENRAQSLSEESFYEELSRTNPAISAPLRQFVQSLEPLGVFPVFTKSMSLKAAAPTGRHYQLGAVERTGQLNTESVNYTALGLGRMDLGQHYQDQIAALLPDGTIRQTPKKEMWRVGVGPNESKPNLSALLEHSDQWRQAIADYVEAITKALEG